MLADIVKDPKFHILFSFIIGFGLASLFRPLCSSQGGSLQCRDYKAPDMKEMRDHIYKIGPKCYRFNPQTMECPATGGKIIEPFHALD